MELISKKGIKLIIGMVVITFLFIGVFVGCVGEDGIEEAFLVDHDNVQKEVEYGTDLDLSGLRVKVKLKNGTYRTLARSESGYSIDDDGYDGEEPDTYTITISYKDFESVSFDITVLEEEYIDENINEDIVMTGIEVKENAGKRLFSKEEEFSSDGIVVQKVYSDDSKEILESSQYEFDYDDYNAFETGEYTITVIYLPLTTMTDTYTVTVTPPIEPELTSITIETDDNSKTTFLYGESFKAEGITVNKNYLNDGIMERQQANANELVFDSSDYDKNTIGFYDITVSIEDTDISSTYEVEVEDYIDGVSVDTSQAQRRFELGDEFSSDGLRVFVNTASGDSHQGNIQDFEIDYSDYDADTLGEYTIEVIMTDNPEIKDTYKVDVLEEIDV